MRKIITVYPETIAQLRQRYSRNRKLIKQGKPIEGAPKFSYMTITGEPYESKK
jgi:hypothetical protein